MIYGMLELPDNSKAVSASAFLTYEIMVVKDYAILSSLSLLHPPTYEMFSVILCDYVWLFQIQVASVDPKSDRSAIVGRLDTPN